MAGRAEEDGRRPAPEATVVCGDMNIAPADEDVFDPDAYIGQTHVTDPERAALADLESLGLHDVVRDHWPNERVFNLLGLPRGHVSTRTSGCGSTWSWRASRWPAA